MRISACACCSSSLVSPVRSAPNTTATGARCASARPRAAPPRARRATRKYWSRSREVVASTKPQPLPGPRPGSVTTRARCEHVVGPGGARAGLRMRKVPRPHQHQLARAPCSSWRAPPPRCCPDARARPGRCECRAVHDLAILIVYRSGRDCIGSSVQPLLNIAVRAARRAGEVIVRSLEPPRESSRSRSKGRNDFVTEVDHAAEREIIDDHPQALSRSRHPRRGKRQQRRERHRLDHRSARWHHQFPARISGVRGLDRVPATRRLEHAVIYDPMRQEIFTAARGGGAHLENHRMRVSKQRGLEGSLLCHRLSLPRQRARISTPTSRCCAR